ncbi:MAG: DUF5317 domain-containing protein [Actinomycetota bacterium]
MRLFIPIIALAILVGYLLRGRLSRLEHLQLRWWWFVLAGLVVQFFPLPEGEGGRDLLVRTGVLAISYGLLLLFAVANLRLPGMWLIALGLACNGLVIVANGGMPVGEEALQDSGQTELLEVLIEQGADKHHLLADDDVLTFLADVIAVPAPVGQVISIGDVFVYAGLMWLIVWAMREPTPSATPKETGRRRGKHRPGAADADRDPAPPAEPPPAATTWGTGR